MTDLLKNKSRPETAANDAAAWVESERALREKLKKEREARELKEKQEVSYPIQIDYRPSSPHPALVRSHHPPSGSDVSRQRMTKMLTVPS